MMEVVRRFCGERGICEDMPRNEPARRSGAEDEVRQECSLSKLLLNVYIYVEVVWKFKFGNVLVGRTLKLEIDGREWKDQMWLRAV